MSSVTTGSSRHLISTRGIRSRPPSPFRQCCRCPEHRATAPRRHPHLPRPHHPHIILEQESAAHRHPKPIRATERHHGVATLRRLDPSSEPPHHLSTAPRSPVHWCTSMSTEQRCRAMLLRCRGAAAAPSHLDVAPPTPPPHSTQVGEHSCPNQARPKP
jgi:hypothetical protein